MSIPSVTAVRLDVELIYFAAVGVNENDIEIVGDGTLGIFD